MKNERGIALVAVAVLILLAAITVLSISRLISGSAPVTEANVSTEQALYAAQAGVYSAIYYYRDTGYWFPREVYLAENNIQGVSAYIGQISNFLLVAAHPARIVSGVYYGIQDFGLTNINALQGLRISKIKVEYYPTTSSGVTIEMNGLTLGSSAITISPTSGPSGTEFSLSTAFQIAAKTGYTGVGQNIFKFNTSLPSNMTLTATFYVSDLSGISTYTRKSVIMKNGVGGNNEFGITSTGRAGVSQEWERTIEATYDVDTRTITSWQEGDTHLEQ